MKIRCTVCGAPNETDVGFDTAFCLTCGSSISVKEAQAYRFPKEMLASLDMETLVQLAKEAYRIHKLSPEALTLLKAAAPSADVEINYLIGLHYFNSREYAKAAPYLYVAAEKMYPDGQCLYGVTKYLQDPDDTDSYPRIRKFLETARDTCSKVFDKVDGEKLLNYINSVLDSQVAPKKGPELPQFTDAPDVS